MCDACVGWVWKESFMVPSHCIAESDCPHRHKHASSFLTSFVVLCALASGAGDSFLHNIISLDVKWLRHAYNTFVCRNEASEKKQQSRLKNEWIVRIINIFVHKFPTKYSSLNCMVDKRSREREKKTLTNTTAYRSADGRRKTWSFIFVRQTNTVFFASSNCFRCWWH